MTAAQRNASLRSAIKAAFPGLRFSVRNGKAGYAAISWVDGPTVDDILTVVRTVPCDTSPGRWGTWERRRCTVGLLAVSYLRARATGARYYEERDTANRRIEPGDVRNVWEVRTECVHLEETVDAATITAEEQRQVALLAQLADLEPDTEIGPDDYEPRRRLARTLYHHGDVLDTVLAAT